MNLKLLEVRKGFAWQLTLRTEEFIIEIRAEVAKLVYALDSKSSGIHFPCRFDSDPRYHLSLLSFSGTGQ